MKAVVFLAVTVLGLLLSGVLVLAVCAPASPSPLDATIAIAAGSAPSPSPADSTPSSGAARRVVVAPDAMVRPPSPAPLPVGGDDWGGWTRELWAERTGGGWTRELWAERTGGGWTRELWAERTAWSVDRAHFEEHFGPFWLRQHGSLDGLGSAWDRAGVQATFRVIQGLRRDLLWELDALGLERTPETNALEVAIQDEGRILAELIGVEEAWDAILAEEQAAGGAAPGAPTLSQE